MLKNFLLKTKYFFSFLLSFVLLFQSTLLTIENKSSLQMNFGELIIVKCNNPEHSHPPLSERKSTHELVKFVSSEANNLFFVNKTTKFFNIAGENIFKKFTPFPALLLVQLLPARGPPYFEV